MTVYDLLEAITKADDELLLRSEVKHKSYAWVKYAALAACVVLVVAAGFAFGRNRNDLPVEPDVTKPTVITENDVTTSETTSESPDITEDPVEPIVNPNQNIIVDDTAPAPFAHSGGDENAWYYESLLPKIGHISATLYKLVDETEFNKWADSVDVLYREGEDVPTDINSFLNVYAMMNYFNLSDEDVTKAFEYELSQDDPFFMNQEDLNVLLSRDEVAILTHFQSEYSIVIGNRIYSPQWVYENSDKAYKEAGIKPEMLKEKLVLYLQSNLTEEAKSYLADKINRYESSLSPAVGGSDYTFARKYVDEVYNIHIASLIVGREACDAWTNDVFLKKSPEEQEGIPTLYQIIVELGISKEDLIKQNDEYSGTDQYLSDYIIDSLYADDIETMKQLLMSPMALYYNKEIYTFDELMLATDKTTKIPKETLKKYFDYIETVCEKEGTIKYMQEDIDRARQAYGVEGYSNGLTATDLVYVFKDKMNSDLENIDKLNSMPEIDIDLSFGGFGFEGILAYDISEFVSNGVWNPSKNISALPIYKNLAHTKYSGIEPYLSEKELLNFAWDIANKLGTTIRYYDCEYIDPHAFDPDSGFTGKEIQSLTATTPKHIIRISGGGRVSIKFVEPVPLPESYSLAYSQENNDNAILTIEYLCREYSELLGYTEVGYSSPIEYNIYDEIHRSYCAYDISGATDTEDVLSSCFIGNSFVGNDTGTALEYIHMSGYNLLSAELLGNYPIISYDEAKQMLIDGKYLTTVPNEYLNNGRILGTDIRQSVLKYRFGSSDSVYMPYYVFYVLLENAPGELPDDLNTYGVYYVPAVSPAYYNEQPKWGGQFGYFEENAEQLYSDSEDVSFE